MLLHHRPCLDERGSGGQLRSFEVCRATVTLVCLGGGLGPLVRIALAVVQVLVQVLWCKYCWAACKGPVAALLEPNACVTTQHLHPCPVLSALDPAM